MILRINNDDGDEGNASKDNDSDSFILVVPNSLRKLNKSPNRVMD